jgi:hypothetical protein
MSSSGGQIAGENYTLTCQVTGGRSITYQWLRDNATLPNETSRTLSFSPLNQRQHNGSYYVCEGIRKSSAVASASLRIIVLGKEYAQHAYIDSFLM